MNERPELARLAMGLLADEPVHVAAPSAEAEARAIELIAKAIEDGGRRRRRRKAVVVVAGVLAFAAGFVGIRIASHDGSVAGVAGRGAPQAVTNAPAVSVAGYAMAGEVRVVHDGHEVPLGDGTKLTASDRIVAPTGRASLAFSTGTHVVVEQGSDVTLAEGGLVQRFDLKSGAVRADVAKLQPGERFVVRTDDTEVEVRGTSFRVAVVPKHTCGVPSATEVSVSEGRVWVRFAGQETVLAAGESWPPPCTTRTDTPAGTPTLVRGDSVGSPTSITLLAPAQQGFGHQAGHNSQSVSQNGPTLSPTAQPVLPTVNTAGRQAVPASTTSDVQPPPASELAEQNRVFEDALSAKRRGDTGNALAGFDRFIAHYPKSPLVESAMAERMRVLASTDESRARDAATQYLDRYPDGFAGTEARAILARSR